MTVNQNVRRLNIGAAEAASDSTDLLVMSQIFLNDSAVGAFSIDLADTRYFIQRSGSIVRDNLGGGNQISISNPVPVTPTFVSFGDVPILFVVEPNIGGLFFVLNPTLSLAQGFNGVTALTLYRSVRQPLPGQLDIYSDVSLLHNVRVQLYMIFSWYLFLSQLHLRLLVT